MVKQIPEQNSRDQRDKTHVRGFIKGEKRRRRAAQAPAGNPDFLGEELANDGSKVCRAEGVAGCSLSVLVKQISHDQDHENQEPISHLHVKQHLILSLWPSGSRRRSSCIRFADLI